MLSEGDINMLNELENLIATEKEKKLNVYIHNLINDLYYNEKIEVNSKELLELLSYLTSNANISIQMKSAIAYQNRNIEYVLHKKEVEILQERIKYLEDNSIPKETIENKLNKLINNFKENYKKENRTYLSIDSAIYMIEKIKKEFVGEK